MLPTRSPCQNPAGNRTTRRSPDDRKETQTAVVWSCFPFIRSGQNHLVRHSERGKKTRRTKEEGEDNVREWTGLGFGKSQRAVENRGKKMEKTGCKIICGAPTTLAVKGLMMMMMIQRTVILRKRETAQRTRENGCDVQLKMISFAIARERHK